MSEPHSTPETGRDELGRWRPGHTGNPGGRRRNRAIQLFDEIIDDDKFRAIVRAAADLATRGNVPAIVAILRLTIPPAPAATQSINVPELQNATDALKAASVLAQAACRGDLDLESVRVITAAITGFLEIHKVANLDVRLRTLEERINR